MRLKIRPAPARAMTMEFNCWDIWLIGMVKLLESCKKAAMAPRVTPPKPERAKAPPTMAINTY